ncbi:PAS domain-containing protein [Nostoc sp. NZL]|uniref:PAS domain-containing protein n=1 Tax=Nostoc sp. NZL TaxID=2650612 RepID=UPI0018C7D134|nr:PAS domain-containing protein [Nostoc sp. NZL]MBG1245120.1 PAS domain-containing protein [Nostoc sp. NZL]
MKDQVLDRIFNNPSFPDKFERLELDDHFCIIDTSEQVQRFAERPEEVIQGKDVRLSFPEFIGLENVLKAILKGEQELFELQAIGRGSENKVHLYIDIYIISEQYENKLIVIIEDVTDKLVLKQKLAQQANAKNLLSSALISYKNYMDQVITAMADALFITSNVGKIKKVNRAAQQLFGFTEEELINQPISLIIDDDEFLIQAIHKHSFFQKNFQNLEVVCRTKTREKRGSIHFWQKDLNS